MPDQQKYVNKLAGKRVLIIGGSSGGLLFRLKDDVEALRN